MIWRQNRNVYSETYLLRSGDFPCWNLQSNFVRFEGKEKTKIYWDLGYSPFFLTQNNYRKGLEGPKRGFILTFYPLLPEKNHKARTFQTVHSVFIKLIRKVHSCGRNQNNLITCNINNLLIIILHFFLTRYGQTCSNRTCVDNKSELCTYCIICRLFYSISSLVRQMSSKTSWLPTARMLWETCPHTVQDKLLEEKKG